jgi:hypothetical protein
MQLLKSRCDCIVLLLTADVSVPHKVRSGHNCSESAPAGSQAGIPDCPANERLSVTETSQPHKAPSVCQ